MDDKEFTHMKVAITMAAKLLSGYCCRIGNNMFDTVDARWILLDPVVFMGIFSSMDTYKRIEGRLDDSIIEESVRVYLAGYMAGGKNLHNMKVSEGRIKIIADEMKKTIADVKAIEITPENCIENLVYLDKLVDCEEFHE
jgi:hypothetical protein